MATRSAQPTGSFYSYSTKRNLRQEEKAAYKRIGLATLVIVTLLVGGYFLGIPLLARLGSGSNNNPDTISNNAGVNDTIPPSAPKLDSPPDAVKTKILSVTGSAESGSTVKVMVNKQDGFTTIAEKDGTFSGQVTLKGGANTLVAIATDQAHNASKPSKEVTVSYDAKAPVLVITAPADNTSAATASVTVTGRADKDATVTINDRQVVVQSDGSFSLTIALANGANTITTAATDKAGNVAKDVRTVNFGDPTAQATTSATP